MTTAAEGYLRARLYLRTVFWQDMPHVHTLVPDHPIFTTHIFQQYAREWRMWRDRVLRFEVEMERLRVAFLCPPMPLASRGAASGLQLSQMAGFIDRHVEELRRDYSAEVTS